MAKFRIDKCSPLKPRLDMPQYFWSKKRKILCPHLLILSLYRNQWHILGHAQDPVGWLWWRGQSVLLSITLIYPHRPNRLFLKDFTSKKLSSQVRNILTNWNSSLKQGCLLIFLFGKWWFTILRQLPGNFYWDSKPYGLYFWFS